MLDVPKCVGGNLRRHFSSCNLKRNYAVAFLKRGFFFGRAVKQKTFREKTKNTGYGNFTVSYFCGDKPLFAATNRFLWRFAATMLWKKT